MKKLLATRMHRKKYPIPPDYDVNVNYQVKITRTGDQLWYK